MGWHAFSWHMDYMGSSYVAWRTGYMDSSFFSLSMGCTGSYHDGLQMQVQQTDPRQAAVR
ncbi:hypothetical protein D8Y20_08380 [Mariprofundus sp. EBB-1]|nr:hypothetical protein D8Y20_08380 [Mariprofundus sp. EBB-1]